MVSVVIVVYNGEKYIAEAIESVLSQTYKNIELIVVDDGSTDRTREVVSKYHNVKYAYQENKGEGSARNLGVNISKGEYIAFLDADDLYELNKIEKQLEILNKYKEIDVVYNDLKVVNENLEFIDILKSEGIYEKRVDLLANIIYRQVIQGPICMMIRRKCIDGIKWSENLVYTVDYDYVIKLALKHNFKYLEEPLYIYRRHGNNLSNKHSDTVKEEVKIIKDLGLDSIKSIISETSFTEVEKILLLSKIYIKIGLYDRAYGYLKNIELDYRSDSVYFYLGLCSYKLEKYKEAIEYYRMAIQINVNMAEAFNNLGCCLYKESKDEAKKCFELAVNIRKNYLDAKNNLNSINNNQNSIKITERELRKVLTSYS